MPVVDSKQGSEPQWPRAGKGKQVGRGVGEELLAYMWRVPEDAGRNLQPVDRGPQDTAPIPLEMTESRGPSSVVHVLGERWSQQNAGQGEDGRRAQRSGDREDVGPAWRGSPHRGGVMGNGDPERCSERVE